MSSSLLKEFQRKLVHLSSLCIPILYLVLPDKHVSRAILVTVTIGFLVADMLKLRNMKVRALYMKLFGGVLRGFEDRTLVGGTYFLMACTLTIYIFDTYVAVAAITFLVLGDTAAALVGKAYGRIKLLDKSVEGSMACFLACIIVGLALPGLNGETILAGAAVATVMELIPSPVDDNFRIPLVSGFIMQILA